MIKKIAVILVSLLIIVICYSLANQTYNALQVDKRVSSETDKLLSLQRKNSELKKELTWVNGKEFIESQARDKLNMARAGETTVIINQDELNRILGAAVEKKEEIIPNWQGWLKLFWK